MGLSLLVCAALALGSAALWCRRPAAVPSVTFSDGRRAEFWGTAAGGSSFTTEKGWHKLARRWLPARLQQWLPPVRSSSCGSGTNSLTVFLNVIDPTGAPIAALPWQSYQAVDEDGFRYPRGGSFCTSGSGAESLVGLVLQAFPRRPAVFRLDLLDGNGGVIGTLRVPNPGRRAFADWTAVRLPNTQSNGPVALTLESVKEHRDKNWHSVMPRWRLEAEEPSWQRARAGYVELEDVTGNQGAFLSRREPVWKLKTTVHREHLEDFAPDEQLNLTNVVIPAPGQFAAMDLSVVRSGVQILVHGIGGAGALVFSNGTQRMMHAPRAPGETGWSTSSGSFGTVERWASDKPFFFIEVTGLEPVDLVQFQLRSDGGREIKLDDGSYSFRAAGGAKTRVYQGKFVPPPEVRRVSLDLMVSRGLPFEFFIDPKAVER